ncbi:MAG: hypothetical protein LUF32_04560 [Clostridiales bacterium]|nr:hypothetical protein [Clostridiales bacterium]
MRQVRMIRISFLICAAIAVAAFWTGWFLGNTGSSADLSAAEDTTDLYLDSGEDASETMSDLNGSGENGTGVSGTRSSETDSSEAERSGPESGSSGTETDSFVESEGNGTKADEGTTENDPEEDDTGSYCLKQEGETLVVYQSGSDEIFFDTGMKVSDLPEEVREDTESGIFFDSLEELYGFLENYSS